MRWVCLIPALVMAAAPLWADTVTATRLVRAQSVLSAADLTLTEGATPGAVTVLAEAVGKEAQVTLYPGRPVMVQDLAAPALVERNAIVTLVYRSALLDIRAEARALGRAAAGERVRVMNLGSRSTVFGIVMADGTVVVQP